MENINTIETFDETIDESVFDQEAFPIKNRSHASRRKKTYFKGKRRFETVYKKGFTPFPEKESIIRGMLRKTNVIKVFHEHDATRFGTNPGTVRRRSIADDKMAEYAMEGV